LDGGWSLPLTVEGVSLLLGARQAIGGRDRVALAQALALEFDAMSRWMTRSRIASPKVGSPMISCQRATGTWLVIKSEPF
jgi:hypothetical protein